MDMVIRGLEKNAAYDLYFTLNSTNGVDKYTTALAAGDVTESNDDGAFGSITPVLTQSYYWKMAFSAAQMNYDDKIIKVVDQTSPKAFMDLAIHLQMSYIPTNVKQVNGTAQTSNDMSGDIDTILSRIIGTLAAGTHNPQGGDAFTRLGAPAGASIAADLLVIDNFVDELESRLTAARAGYLDELGAANIPADIDTLLSRLSAARAGYLDELAAANIPADIDTLLSRISATRAGYLDNLSGGAVALAAVCTAARLAELDAANIPADIDTLKTRVPAEAALKEHLVNGTGDITPPTNTGIWNVLEDLIDGGRLDLLIDAIKAVTDLLPDAGALTTIITHLTDIKGTGFVKDTNSLVNLALSTTVALITAKLPSKAYLSGSVDADGGIDATELAVVVAGVLAGIIDGTVDLKEALTQILAYASGNVAKSGNAYSYKERDGVTNAFTNTAATGSRTRS